MPVIAIVNESIDVLPFKEILDWERYQRFCTDVLSIKIGVIDSREYLTQGSKQDGIDVYAVEINNDKKIVAQCKLEKYLSPKDIKDLVQKFLEQDLSNDVKEFILCTTYDLKTLAAENAIEDARKMLKARNIILEVWDQKGLSKYLRTYVSEKTINIVYHYFKENITKAFYGEIWNDYIDKLRKIPKPIYEFSNYHIERTITAYSEYQKKKIVFEWDFSSPKKYQTLIDFFENRTTNENKKVVLLSTAGFGKTEELNHLSQFYSNDSNPIYAIRFFLRDYEGQDIEQLLASFNTDWKNIPPQNLILLFDGLDEVQDKYFLSFINHLNFFIETNKSVNALLTSRFNFYDLSQQLLRGFDVYILQPLSNEDIDNFLTKKLGNQKEQFIDKTKDNKFYEYIDNPYYLTRLVRLFLNINSSFPKNKSELFERILFEQLENDEAKYNVADLKSKLFPQAKKVAFCMTLTGKNFLLKNELNEIIERHEDRQQLRNFCILNLNNEKRDAWAFEHNNLREYLCACFLSEFSFNKIKDILSFNFNRQRLLPRFLNTLSFLFELLDKSSNFFSDLFNWIQTTQPELFIRFEKEQISKTDRQRIFKEIFSHYIQKNITLRISSNFSIEELADFADIDLPIILYLKDKLLTSLNAGLTYDALQLLSYVKRAFRFKAELTDTFSLVSGIPSYESFVLGQCAYSWISIDANDKKIFEDLLSSKLDLSNFEIRRKIISALDSTSYFQEYPEFLINSIKIYNDGQKNSEIGGVNYVLKRLIIKLKTAYALKKLLQCIISNPLLIDRHHHYKLFQFEADDIEKILSSILVLAKSNSSFLPLVYRIFVSMKYLDHEEKLFQPFKQFFIDTCGTEVIFKKLYRYGKKDRLMLNFANKNCIDFLVNEYLEGKLSQHEMIVFRNRLSWKNRELLEYYMKRLNDATNNEFLLEEDKTDYQQLNKDYEIRNQLLLLDKIMFLNEASKVFDAIGKESIGFDDIYTNENNQLRQLQYSRVYHEISYHSHRGRGNKISKNEFIKRFDNDNFWNGYVIEEIEEYLSNKKNIELLPAIKLLATDWLQKNLSNINFATAVKDNKTGGVTYNRLAELANRLYLLVDVDIKDDTLLNMLSSDFSGITSDEKVSLSGKIINQVKNTSLLKTRIIENIRSKKLATWVLSTHFKLCHQLHYQECLSELFLAITTNTLILSYERRKLTDYYLDLGGEILDFIEYLKVPGMYKDESYLIEWDWYLIEKFINVEPQKVCNILLEIYKDGNQPDSSKVEAIRLLIKMGESEGLNLSLDYIKHNQVFPFDYHSQSIIELFVNRNTSEMSVTILIDILDYTFENKIFAERGFDSIQEIIYNFLIQLVLKNKELHGVITEKINYLSKKYSTDEKIYDQLIFFSERFNQRFYENYEYLITIEESIIAYNNLVL